MKRRTLDLKRVYVTPFLDWASRLRLTEDRRDPHLTGGPPVRSESLDLRTQDLRLGVVSSPRISIGPAGCRIYEVCFWKEQ